MEGVTMRRNENVFQDPHSGGWVAEVLIDGRWILIGTYGSRAAAMKALGHK